MKEYYLRNKLKWGKSKNERRIYQQTYRILHKEKLIQYRRSKRIKLIKFLGDFCHDCGFNADVRALQIDHIFGKGTQEAERKFTSNFAMYNYYLKHPQEAKHKLQILCANCNTIKRYTHGEGCYGS